MINPGVSVRFAGEAPPDFPCLTGEARVLGAPVTPGIYVNTVSTTGFNIYWLKDLCPRSCDFLEDRDCLTHNGLRKVNKRPCLPADRRFSVWVVRFSLQALHPTAQTPVISLPQSWPRRKCPAWLSRGRTTRVRLHENEQLFEQRGFKKLKERWRTATAAC